MSKTETAVVDGLVLALVERRLEEALRASELGASKPTLRKLLRALIQKGKVREANQVAVRLGRKLTPHEITQLIQFHIQAGQSWGISHALELGPRDLTQDEVDQYIIVCLEKDKPNDALWLHNDWARAKKQVLRKLLAALIIKGEAFRATQVAKVLKREFAQGERKELLENAIRTMDSEKVRWAKELLPKRQTRATIDQAVREQLEDDEPWRAQRIAAFGASPGVCSRVVLAIFSRGAAPKPKDCAGLRFDRRGIDRITRKCIKGLFEHALEWARGGASIAVVNELIQVLLPYGRAREAMEAAALIGRELTGQEIAVLAQAASRMSA